MIAVALICGAVALLPDAIDHFGWRAEDRFTRPWTALTAQFVHLDARHLGANLIALALLGWTASRIDSGGTPALHSGHPRSLYHAPTSAGLQALTGALAAVALGLWIAPGGLTWYVGLSGALYGLFAYLALALGGHRGVTGIGYLLYAGGWIKVGLDLAQGPGAIGALGLPTAPIAHLYGYLGGSVIAAVSWVRRRRPPV